MPTKQQIGRLAMRHEGQTWNAYYALTDSFDQAVFLGSIRFRAIEQHPQRRELFMNLMRDLVADIIEDETGVRPTWGGVQPAPEHERAGHG